MFNKTAKAIFITSVLIFLNIQAVKAQEASSFLSNIKAVAIRLKPGQDLKIQLDHYINTNHISAACIITCVGSLQTAAIRYANQPGVDTLKGHFEIVSLTGTLGVKGSHLHISVGDSTGRTMGGHLKEGSQVYTTAEIVIGILPELEFNRETDLTYGYKELSIKKKKK